MNRWLLLRTMIAKEIRTTFRERNQVFGLVVSLVTVSVAIILPALAVSEKLKDAPPPEVVEALITGATTLPAPAATVRADTTAPATDRLTPGAATTTGSPAGAPPPTAMPASMADMPPALIPVAVRIAAMSPREVAGVRWVAAGLGAGIGMLIALGYLTSATIATFAAEKEARTLELVLASPVSDTTLFVGKCLGALVPGVVVGYAFAVVAVALVSVFLRDLVAVLPVNAPFAALVLSVPLFVLPALALVGLGAAVSARADTTKGAGQVLGAVFFVVFFGLGYGVPLLIQSTPLGAPIKAVGAAWLDWPFPAQYAAAVAALAVPAVLCVAAGRMLFRRDRLLT